MREFVVIQTEDDVYLALAVTRRVMQALSLSAMDEQMVLVSVAELTRNVLDHADARGHFCCERVSNGVYIEVVDRGPGIENLNQIMSGCQLQSKRGLGLGLAGVARLMDRVTIETSPKGSRIVAIKWDSYRQDRRQHDEPIGSHRQDVRRDRP